METRIQHAFAKNGIVLKNSLTDAKACHMPNGITNKFYIVRDVLGQKYIIRLNGKLWPPFSRTDENHNLRILHRQCVATSVLYNDSKQEFQICYKYRIRYQFSLIKNPHDHTLKLIGEYLRKIHSINSFNNFYSLPQTVNASLARTNASNKETSNNSQKIIMSILAVLHPDTTNHVSSHNDLLPSSIYCKGNIVACVDWEYAARNHRSYDIALFFLNTLLTYKQEQHVLTAYDPNNTFNMSYYMFLMKPVVGFLLLQWSLSKQDEKEITRLSQSLVTHLRNAAFGLPIKTHVASQEEKEVALVRKRARA